MAGTTHAMDLTGKLLLAMPGMGDPRFDKSVIYLCAHSDDGAMGLIVNKPAPDLEFDRLLEQVKIRQEPGHRSIPVHFGGPMENGRGFVLHSTDWTGSGSTLRVDDRFAMTATLDILEDIARGFGPDACMLALGYAGWGPGQIEREILGNGWLTCDAAPAIVFARENAPKWERALGTLGIDPVGLSAAAGRA